MLGIFERSDDLLEHLTVGVGASSVIDSRDVVEVLPAKRCGLIERGYYGTEIAIGVLSHADGFGGESHELKLPLAMPYSFLGRAESGGGVKIVRLFYG
jgi:hypothetical protein